MTMSTWSYHPSVSQLTSCADCVRDWQLLHSSVILGCPNYYFVMADDQTDIQRSCKRFEEWSKEFQKAKVCVFEKYQFSRLYTHKCHALSHLPDNIEDVAWIEILRWDIYEIAHNKFKGLHSLTFKLCIEVFQENIQLHNESDDLHDINDGQLVCSASFLNKSSRVNL